MPLGEAVCKRCELGFDPTEQIVNSAGELWHPDCFVCAQCFQPFPDGIFYEFEGRKYCEHDFQVLFAPCCQLCSEYLTRCLSYLPILLPCCQQCNEYPVCLVLSCCQQCSVRLSCCLSY